MQRLNRSPCVLTQKNTKGSGPEWDHNKKLDFSKCSEKFRFSENIYRYNKYTITFDKNIKTDILYDAIFDLVCKLELGNIFVVLKEKKNWFNNIINNRVAKKSILSLKKIISLNEYYGALNVDLDSFSEMFEILYNLNTLVDDYPENYFLSEAKQICIMTCKYNNLHIITYNPVIASQITKYLNESETLFLIEDEDEKPNI